MINGGSLRIEPGRRAGSYVIVGEIDMATAEAIAKIDVPAGANGVVLDLSRVTFIDSSGVRAIVELCSRLPGGTVVVDRPSRPVRVILDMVDVAELPGVVVRER